MPSREQVLAVAAEWLGKADEDLAAAVQLLKMGNRCPAATVGFHAQQCVEKCLKALLSARSVNFCKTHDVEILVGQLPVDIVVSLPVTAQRTLTAYATVTRYPGDYDPVTVKDARQAVSWARRLRRSSKSYLQ